MHKLKQDLRLLQGALDVAALDVDTQRLFGQLALRARFVDVVWTSHLKRIEAFCGEMERSMANDHSVIAQGYAQRLRVIQLEQELERRKLQEKVGQQARDHAQMMQLLRYQKADSQRVLCDAPEDGDANDSRVTAGGNQDEGEGAPDAWNWAPAMAAHRPEFRLTGTIHPELRARVCESLTVLDLGARVCEMDRNDLLYLVSQLSDIIKQTLIESLLHSSSGAARLGLLKEFLLEGSLLLELSAEDDALLGTLVDSMSIEGRMRLLVHLLQVSNPSGCQGDARENFAQFQALSAEYLHSGSAPCDRRADCAGEDNDEDAGDAGDLASKRVATAESPFVSIHIADGFVDVRGHGATRDACVGPDVGTCMSSLAALEARVRGVLEEGRPDAELHSLVVKHAERYLGAAKGAAYSVKLVVTPSKSSHEKPLFSAKPHPWTKFLQLSKRKHVREVSLETVLGDVYAAKVLLDQDLRRRGERKPLCNVVMDYFTQKYGLRKLAREYTLGLVKTVRAQAASSTRAETFGIACGVMRESQYSPIVGDVVTEFIAQLYGGSADVVGTVFSKSEGTVFLPLSTVLGAVGSTFVAAEKLDSRGAGLGPLVLPSAEMLAREVKTAATTATARKKSKVAKKASVVGAPGHAPRATISGLPSQLGGEVKRSWTMPGAVRQRMMTQLEGIARPADSIEACKESGTVLYCDVDRALEIVLNLFLVKLDVDRAMLMHLFGRFDVDGNGVLSLEEFTDLLSHCQPMEALDEHGVIELWNKVNESEDDDDDSDNITKEGFATVCIAQGLQLNYWRIADIKEKLDEILVARGIHRLRTASSVVAVPPRLEASESPV